MEQWLVADTGVFDVFRGTQVLVTPFYSPLGILNPYEESMGNIFSHLGGPLHIKGVPFTSGVSLHIKGVPCLFHPVLGIMINVLLINITLVGVLIRNVDEFIL